MARMTKAQLEALRKEAEAVQRALDADAYPTKLMAALEEATQKNNYELTVKNGMFNLVDRNAAVAVLSLTATYTQNSWNALECLEWDLQQYAEERAESERLSAVRRAAFAKLSEEEKNVLGLTDRNNW